MHRIRRFIGNLSVFAVALFAAGCANIGNPSGGPRDEDPPIFISADPAPGSLNVKKTKMTLTFNELINVKDAFSKVVVSPVSKSVPRVMSLGKNITVTFDSLQPDVTYTVDFADAIEDNNEGNKLQGFTYSFSTGATIDSLRISGMVLGARDLEPQQEMIVGVTENLADSAFTRLPLLRVAKTDDRGRFTIRGLKEGRYRIYALGDKDNDYKYANPEEDIAFYDFEIEPSSEQTEAQDSIFDKLTGKLDSVVTRTRTRFLPNDILLRSFNSQKRPQYLVKYERQDSTKIFLKFNTRADSMPAVEAIGYPGLLGQSVIERRPENDSIIYWLPKPLVGVDSLQLQVRYLRTDSAGLVEKTDTLKLFTARAREVKKKKKSEKDREAAMADSLASLSIAVKAVSPTSHEVYQPVTLRFDTPLESLDQSRFHLEMQQDTVWKQVSRQPELVLADSLMPRDYLMDYEWKYGTKYRLVGDTIAAMGIYGQPTRPFTHEFTVKKKDDYCSLRLTLTGLEPGIPAFVELLTSSDAIARTEQVKDNTVFFQHLDPGKYYARVIEDYNGNGLYDTGDYDQLLQPELAYYYPKMLNIKKNWDKEETWDVFATAIDLQKPAAVKKNKPAADKRNRNQTNGQEQEEEEDDWFDPTANPFDPNQKRNRPSY